MKRERLKARLEKLYARLDRRLGGRLSLLVRTALAFGQDDGPLAARSIAYYALFAVFPAILALIVVASAVLESEEVQESVMALVAQYAPIALDVVAVNIEQLLAKSKTVGLIALVGLIWSASGVASAIFQAVNRAWGVPNCQARPVGKAVWPGHDFRRRRLSSAGPVHWPHREFGPGLAGAGVGLAALCPARRRPAGELAVGSGAGAVFGLCLHPDLST